MTKIALDANALAALATTESGVIAITDAAGNVVGFFAPVKQEYAEQYAEMAARVRSVWGEAGPPRHPLTTAEVIERLNALEPKQ
jgi:hypothetical protein